MHVVRNRIKFMVMVSVLALAGAAAVRAEVTMTTANAMTRVTKKVSPDFPVAAKQLHISGSQEVQITVSKTGEVTDVKVVKGNMMFSNSSITAARQWKFSPLMKDGAASEFTTILIFNYGQ